jgi:two-component system sensor histidine kinase DctS
MGLGLAICRSLIEMNGGRIDHRDRPEGGTEFTIAIPRASRRTP